jgi:tetratricopeptide (TPR) repeat protein
MRNATFFASFFAVVMTCSLLLAQNMDGVVFVDDIESAMRRQTSSPQLPTLGRPSPVATPTVTSIPREALQQPQVAEPSSGFRGPFAWLRRGASESSQTPPAARQAPPTASAQPDYAVRQASASQPVGASNMRQSVHTRNVSQDSRRGLFGMLSDDDRSQAAPAQVAAPSAPSASGNRRGRPTAANTLSRTATQTQTQTAPSRQQPTNSPSGTDPFRAPAEVAARMPMPMGAAVPAAPPANMPMPISAGSNQASSPAEPSAVVWTDDAMRQTPVANATPPAPKPTTTAMPRSAGPVAPGSQVVSNPFAEHDTAANATNRPSATQATASQQSQPRVATPVVAQSQSPNKVAIVANPVTPVADVEEKPSPRAASLLVDANSMAQSASTEEEFSQIVQMCRHVLAIDSTPVAVNYGKTLGAWALNRRGELKADQLRDDQAMIDFDDAIRFDTNCWRAIHNRGVLKAQHGDFDGALADFDSTIQLNPKFAKAYSNRAALRVQAGDLAAALDDYRQAIAFDPDLAIAHKGRGRVCHLLGKFDVALQHFDAAALLAPTDAQIATSRADLLADMGRYYQAIDGYKVAISLDANLAAAHRGLAWMLATCPASECRNPQQALASAERARALAANDDDVTLDTLAAAKASAGDFAAAIELQRQVVSLASNDDREVYQARLTLYEQQQPYRTEPASDVQQATYVE